MRGDMPNTVARRKLMAFGCCISSASTATLSIAYCEIGCKGEVSEQKLPAAPEP